MVETGIEPQPHSPFGASKEPPLLPRMSWKRITTLEQHYRPEAAELGTGLCSTVFQASPLPSAKGFPKRVAVKQIRKDALERQTAVFIENELNALRLLQHPAIVKLYDCLEDESHFYVVLEYGATDLLTVLEERRRFTEAEAAPIFRALAEGIQHCHQNNLVHRDIKLENVILCEGGCKIIDFGFSKQLPHNRFLLTDYCGTPAYVAPELLLRKPYDGFAADVWSLGVLLYTLVAGRLPFSNANLRTMAKKIIQGDYSFPEGFSLPLRNLLRGMLCVDRTSRYTIAQVLSSQWLQSLAGQT